MTTPDLLCLKGPQFCGEFCSEGFGALKANMLGKKGMIHQSLYKDFQKLLFLHLGGLFHKLTLALEKWNFVKSTSSKQEKWTSTGVGAPVKASTFSFRMATSFGSKNISLNLLRCRLQKDLAATYHLDIFILPSKPTRTSYPHDQAIRVSNFSVFFSVGIFTLRFSQVGFYCHLGAFNWGATSTQTPQVM